MGSLLKSVCFVTWLILFYVDDIIKAKPCLQNGPRRRKKQKCIFMIKKRSDRRSGQASADM